MVNIGFEATSVPQTKVTKFIIDVQDIFMFCSIQQMTTHIFTLHYINNNHDHDVEAKSKRLNEDSKAKVLEMIEIGVTEPRRIIKELDKCNLPLLTKTQISNLKSGTNVKQNGNSKCTLNQWLEWIKKRRELPEDIDEIFVVDYSYSFSKSKPNQLKDMRCFLTTRRLVNTTIKSKIFSHF